MSIFFSVFAISFFPRVSLPIIDCNDYLDRFEFCEKQKDKCISESIDSIGCITGYCECLKEIKPISEECKKAAEGLCTRAKTENSEKIYTQSMMIEESKVMVILNNPLDYIKENCYQDLEFDTELENFSKQLENFTEFNRAKLPTAIVLNTLIKRPNKSTQCVNGLKRLAEAGGIMDQDTYSKIRVSMKQWHCGWNLGEIGLLVLRVPFVIESSNTAIDFNHCCSVHRNCYFVKLSKQDCDEEFRKCTKNVVNQRQGEKSGAMELQKILVEAHLWDSNTTYENVGNTEHKYATYSESLEQGFDGFRETGKSNYTVTFLEPGHEFSKEVRESVRKAYQNCKNHRFSISSSIYIYIHCNQFSKSTDDDNDKCFKRFDGSFSGIDITDGKCQESIKKLRKVIGPTPDGWFLITSFIDSLWLRYLAEAVFIFLSAAEVLIFIHRGYRYCKRCQNCEKQRCCPECRRKKFPEEEIEAEQLVNREIGNDQL